MTASRTERLTGWAAGLRFPDIPGRVVALAKSQVLSQLAAVRAGAAHPLGRTLVRAFGDPLQDDPRRSAPVIAGLGSWLNLDDTAYAGHLSNSTVAVPLAYARSRGLSGAALLTAVVAANECAARVTAAATLGPFRGQTAAHTSLVGAVAGRLHCEEAPARRWTDALGLAMTMPPWTLLHGFLSGDARVLAVLTPVRAAMDACDAAEAGVRSGPDVLDHPEGFLPRFAAVPLPGVLDEALGRRWHTDTLSFKLRPGGPGIDSAVDCALELTAAGFPAGKEIEEVVVETSRYTMYVGRLVEQHGHGPGMPESLLPLSVPYAVATVLLTGGLTVADFTAPASRDERRWHLASRVRMVEDPGMTHDLLASTAPFGAAIREAGERALDWLAGFAGRDAARSAVRRPPEQTFEHATKHTGARVTVHWSDGGVASARRDIPAGAAGPGTRDRHWDLVVEKFRAAGGEEDVIAACAGLEHATPAELSKMTGSALGGH